MIRIAICSGLLLLAGCPGGLPEAGAQRFVPNYDSAKIPDYTLPPILALDDGSAVTRADQWPQRRREILSAFRRDVYGRSPSACSVEWEATAPGVLVLNGSAVRREVKLYLGDPQRRHPIGLLIYTPVGGPSAPAFLTLNFQGNHSIDPDPGIAIPTSWVSNRKNGTTDGNVATDRGRGVAARRWPVERIVGRGYALVTLYYGDIDPDFDDGFKNGIHGRCTSFDPPCPIDQRWGSIAAWAYGLSRVMDYLASDDFVDASRVAVLGHSRLGKAALWAGATDSRFKVVISNNSGCGGAAISRRAFGETVGRINASFPHWFCPRFKRYSRREGALPVDQHQLIAAIAPRAVYVASAVEDRWADPEGEFIAIAEAAKAYRLLGTPGFATPTARVGTTPPVDQPINKGVLGYHLRSGKHDVTHFDWSQYLDFADRNL